MPKSRERKKVKNRRRGRQTPPGSKRQAREMIETLGVIEELEAEYQREYLQGLQDKSFPEHEEK